MMLRTMLSIGLIACMCFGVFAQGDMLQGKVVDRDNKALPFVTIKLKRKSIGVISNNNGDFQFPLREEFKNDTLLFTCIGYASKNVPIASLSLVVFNPITLFPSQIQLSTVEIRGKKLGRLTATQIVRAAINNISRNYAQQPFSYVAYYRDYQVRDNQYINLNEALVNVNDKGFQSNDQVYTKLNLLQYRINDSFSRDTLTSRPYDNVEKKFIPNATLGSFGGNELAILMVHDAIRNNNIYSYSFVNIFAKDFIDNHALSLKPQVLLDTVRLHVVEFISRQEATGTSHYSIGKLYIEKGNYKIHKMEYATFEKAEGKRHLLYNIVCEYTNKDNQMYLNYISFNNEFKMRDPDDFKIAEVAILANLSGFAVRFTHPLERASALDKNNYEFLINGKPMEIESIDFSVTEGREVIVAIKDMKQYGVVPATIAKQTTPVFKHIKDQRNREVNVPTFIEAFQYRETFVQQVNGTQPKDLALIDKNKPLSSEETAVHAKNTTGYWMNTPLKKDFADVP